jgi:D-alanine-D-alanine ligase
MGGPSAEREVSLKTGRAVLAALVAQGYDAVHIEVAPGGAARLPSQLEAAEVDVVWLALHGTLGEDGCVQGLLEVMAVPYTGSGVLASALAMDKVMAKKMFETAGLPTPRWTLWPQGAAITDGALDAVIARLGLPLVVKPSQEGSSVGVAMVHRRDELPGAIAQARGFHGETLVEQQIAGREIQVGVLDGRALGTIEVKPAVEFYDYQAKYTRTDTQYLCPAPVGSEVDQRLRQVAETAHRALGCRGHTRVDFMVGAPPGGSDGVWLLEVNTLPGMTDKSLLPKIAAHAGLDYATLVERILDTAGSGMGVGR